MKKRAKSEISPEAALQLKALRRAARQALNLAIQTGTPCWVMEGDKIVNIAAKPAKKKATKPRQSKP